MFYIDMLPVENEAGKGEKSGDAIAIQVTMRGWSRPPVVVIDAGFTDTSAQVAKHILDWYGTSHIDLMISTHPDNDHLNGLEGLLDSCTVGELLLHQPWLYNPQCDVLGNFDRLVSLYTTAVDKGVPVTQPFTGLTRLNGVITIVGPTERYYKEMLAAAIDEARTGVADSRRSSTISALLSHGADLLEKAANLVGYPLETLDNVDDTGPRNKMSVITLLRDDGQRALFTGDIGIAGLSAAIDVYESLAGTTIDQTPLTFFQAPHHGSKHNLGPDILDRVIGTFDNPHGLTRTWISSAKSSKKHPSPKVTNALGHRGGLVSATEGNTLSYHWGFPGRPNWTRVPLIGPLDESD